MTPTPVTRSALVTLAISGWLVAAAAHAQTPPAPPAATDPQLDRIEGKLDDILRRLDAQKGLQSAQPAPSPPADRIPAQATQPSAAPGAAPATTAYKPGAVAIVRAAPDRVQNLQTIPADSVGGFVYAGGPITLQDLKPKGVRYTGLAGIELQGWLKVAVAGRTELALEFRAITGATAMIPPSCLLAIWLEERSIGSQTGEIPVPAREEKTLDLVLGADLQPGLYRLRLWAACTPTRDLKLAAELLTKSPADMNLRPVTATDLLHQGS